MNRRRVIVSLCCAGMWGSVLGMEPPGVDAHGEPCAACHEEAARAFATSVMARAARTPDFLREWRGQDAPSVCLDCHAPTGGGGVACADCHGGGGHPYPAVAVPDACARCHDAPGENTVRTFLAAPARRGEDCIDCHAPADKGRFSHGFKGPSDRSFLKGVARLRLVGHRTGDVLNATVQIRHDAGHALPGGTTGRAVWLWIEGIGVAGETVWRESRRFGWEHTAAGGWRDRTLLPGRSTAVELRDLGRAGARRVRVRLTYQYQAGAPAAEGAGAVVLDGLEIDLPRNPERRKGIGSTE